MKIRLARICLAATSVLAGCHRAAATSAAPGVLDATIVRDIGLEQPENLVYDPVADVYLVSNMAGDTALSQNAGYISRVSPDGRMLDLRWIAGGVRGAVLHAPKGLALHGDTLAVADLGGVGFFDRQTGAPMGSIALPGLVMNDVAFADDGAIWVTDTGPGRGPGPIDTTKDLDAVWRIGRDRRVQSVARGLSLQRPDGIVLEGTGALITTFGGRRIERLMPTRSEVTVAATLPADSLDGLRRLADGSLIVTSWHARTVWRLDRAWQPHTVLTGVTSPAGVAIDTRRHRLAVTSMLDNTLYLAPLP